MAKDGKPISRESLRRALRTSIDRADPIIKIIRAEARQAGEAARDTPPHLALIGLAPAATPAKRSCSPTKWTRTPC
jgi:hypothetical protein